mgnify:CR=1 FL=1
MALKKHIPNTITSMNLLAGAMGVIFTFQHRPDIAFACMLAAAVFDFCDGLAARLLGAYSAIGKELDSLCDMVSFGLLPALMLVETMQRLGGPSWSSYLPLFLAVMSALRLAKFNIDERQETDFIGVATPTAAMISGALCCYVHATPGSFLAAWAEAPWFLPTLSVLLGVLLVSEIPMFGMKVKPGHKLLDAKRIVFLALSVAVLLAVVVSGKHLSLAVFAIFVIYILENLVIHDAAVLRKYARPGK